MRKTACPVVWEGGGAQSPSLDPIQGTRPTDSVRKWEKYVALEAESLRYSY